MSDIRVTVWNEGRHEKASPEIAAIYPKGMHGAIAEYLNSLPGITAGTATLDDPEQGLPDSVLQQTDVLIWWGHGYHHEVDDRLVDRIQERILNGMGLIVLHSGHYSKIFKRMMGTSCSLSWREANEHERLWVVKPNHPIAAGLDDHFEIEKEEMYGEYFDIPQPDELVLIGWFAGGEVFRSGCCYTRGHGRIFYFQPGHETHPVYHNANVLKVIGNAVCWAAPTPNMVPREFYNMREPHEKIG